MRTLDTLVKLHNTRLVNLLSIINTQEKQIQEFKTQIHDIEQACTQEVDQFSNTPYSYVVEHYTKKIKHEIFLLNQEIRRSIFIISQERKKLKEEYIELKRFETLRDRKKKEYIDHMAKLESKNLDAFNSLNVFYKTDHNVKKHQNSE